MKYFRRVHDSGLERRLRRGRSVPRAEFVSALAGEVGGRPVQRPRAGRIGLALALSGLVVVAVASFGGIGYAATSGSKDAKKPTGKTSAAAAQYKTKPAQELPFKPPKATSQPQPTPSVTPTAKSSELPFTGLALWIPLAVGFTLIATGLTLRVKSRRRGGSTAH